MLLLLFALFIIGFLLYANHINHPILAEKPKSKLKRGPRKPSDIEEDSIREKTKEKVEDSTAEEAESLSEKIDLNSKELISMPNGNDKNVKENVQMKAELKGNEKGKAISPVTPPIKQPQNIVKQSSTQPEPCINSTFGAQTAKPIVLGLPRAAAVQLPVITAPNSVSTPPDIPTQTHDVKTNELIPANIPLRGTPTHNPNVKQLTMSPGIPPAAAVPPHPVSSPGLGSSPNVVTAKSPRPGAATPMSPHSPGTSQPGTELANNCVTAQYPATGTTTPRTVVSVTGRTHATTVKPSVYVPGTKLDPLNAQAPANLKNPVPPGKPQHPQSDKGNSDTEGSSESSTETAWDISTIPPEERAKYSFLRNTGQSKYGNFTLRGEDTLAMHDLDLFDENKAPQMDMKALHDYFAQPVGAPKVHMNQTCSSKSPKNVKKKKRKRKSALLKGMFRDKKKKTTAKTPPTAQKT